MAEENSARENLIMAEESTRSSSSTVQNASEGVSFVPISSSPSSSSDSPKTESLSISRGKVRGRAGSAREREGFGRQRTTEIKPGGLVRKTTLSQSSSLLDDHVEHDPGGEQ